MNAVHRYDKTVERERKKPYEKFEMRKCRFSRTYSEWEECTKGRKMSFYNMVVFALPS